MERLTEKHYLCSDYYMKCSEECNVDVDCIDCPAFEKLVDRLGAYEDTGLEPEDVTDMMAAHGTAIGALAEYRKLGPINRFRELAQADREKGCRWCWTSANPRLWRSNGWRLPMNPVEKHIFENAPTHYGPEAQIKMLYEEMAEIQLAVCKNGRGADNLDNIAEEIADVGIMLDQMRLLFGVGPLSDVKRSEKVARLAERMDNA